MNFQSTSMFLFRFDFVVADSICFLFSFILFFFSSSPLFFNCFFTLYRWISHFIINFVTYFFFLAKNAKNIIPFNELSKRKIRRKISCRTEEKMRKKKINHNTWLQFCRHLMMFACFFHKCTIYYIRFIICISDDVIMCVLENFSFWQFVFFVCMACDVHNNVQILWCYGLRPNVMSDLVRSKFRNSNIQTRHQPLQSHSVCYKIQTQFTSAVSKFVLNKKNCFY